MNRLVRCTSQRVTSGETLRSGPWNDWKSAPASQRLRTHEIPVRFEFIMKSFDENFENISIQSAPGE